MLEHELNVYWRTVVNTIQDGVMIVDRGGTIVSANKALKKITGYGDEELVGESCTIFNCTTCKAARNEVGEQWCKLFTTGELSIRRCALMKKDGSYVPVIKNAALLHDSGGRVIGAVETLTDISELVEKDSQIEAFRRELRREDSYRGIIGASAPMQRVFDLITNAAQSDAPVIIFGESGTGKELVARAIHDAGTRKAMPYVKVNCAALNENLLESELFGHVKGAYTGAHQNRKGRFEAASGGDIFLDEIGDLPAITQVKLLRVLEEHVVERVGDNQPIHVDVRIVTATNRRLRRMVREGAFREDLFYRINVIPIDIPPLRERRGDIALLAEAFFRRIRLKSDKAISGISNEAMDALMHYDWPGNVRELKSAMEYAFVTCHESRILPGHLPPGLHAGTEPVARKRKKGLDRDEDKKKQLLDALTRTGGHQTRAAELLGVSRVTIWNRMKKYGISSERKFRASDAPHTERTRT